MNEPAVNQQDRDWKDSRRGATRPWNELSRDIEASLPADRVVPTEIFTNPVTREEWERFTAWRKLPPPPPEKH